MKLRWIFLFGLNLVNSLYMAFLLVQQCLLVSRIKFCSLNQIILLSQEKPSLSAYSSANSFDNNLESFEKS